MSDIDIDKSILALESQLDGKSSSYTNTTQNSNLIPSENKSSKSALIKRLIFGSAITFLVIFGLKPLFICNVKYNEEKEICEVKFKWAKVAVFSALSIAVLYFIGSKIPFLN